MPETLPTWELLKPMLTSFAHDHINSSALVGGAATLLDMQLRKTLPEASAEFERLHGESISAYLTAHANALQKVHDKYQPFRRGDVPPADAVLRRELAEWKSDFSAMQRDVHTRAATVLKFLGNYRGRSPQVDEWADKLLESLKGERKFTASDLTKLRLRLEPVDLNEELQRFVGAKHIDREGRPVKIVYSGRPMDKVFIDRNLLLHRALENLVSDAIMHGTRNSPIEMKLSPGKRNFRIHVTNEGPFLSRADLAVIGKKRWTQRPENEKRGHGKIAANMIAKAHGGRLEVKNSYRNGRHYGPQLSLAIPRSRDITRVKKLRPATLRMKTPSLRHRG